jgi:hypothetical protein
MAFQKEVYNGIPNVTVWRVLRNHLGLKLSIVQGVERWRVCTLLYVKGVQTIHVVVTFATE